MCVLACLVSLRPASARPEIVSTGNNYAEMAENGAIQVRTRAEAAKIAAVQ
jgi:hypothetical protein